MSNDLTEIPGVGSARAEKLGNAGFDSIDEVADTTPQQISDLTDMSIETSRAISTGAKSARGDSDTELVAIANEMHVERSEVEDAFSSIAGIYEDYDTKLKALRTRFSSETTILDLEDHSIYDLFLLFSNGFNEVQSVAEASIDELTDVPYITHQAEEIRESARELAGYDGRSDQASKSETATSYACPDCGQEFKFERVRDKHIYSCSGSNQSTSENKRQNETNRSNRSTSTAISPNPLTEYYESIRSVREAVRLLHPKVTSDDLSDPISQYYSTLYKFTNNDLETDSVSGYGPQHVDRVDHSVSDYRVQYGNGEWITSYEAISVSRPKLSLRDRINEVSDDPDLFVAAPVPTESDNPIPLSVETWEDLEQALNILSQLPAKPPTGTTGTSTTQKYPVLNCYTNLVENSDVPRINFIDDAQTADSKKRSPENNNLETSDNLSDQNRFRESVFAPEEIPVPNIEEYTVNGSDAVYPNHLSEYYESFRSTRKALELAFKVPGIDVDPRNKRDPRVQYFILLDACIGFGSTSAPFTGYGLQHQDRLPFGINDYRKKFGESEIISEYQVVNVEPFNYETQQFLKEQTDVKTTRGFVRPCIPGTDYPIPELPGSIEQLKRALELLATFPAYPPLPIEDGASNRTLPITKIYEFCFEELDEKYKVDLTTLSSDSDSQPTGPVPDATPTSTQEAESKLLDYGRLSHLYKRVTPPTESPIDRSVNVFALEWYRPSAPNYNALQTLAKRGDDGAVDVFRSRLRDLIHRRFLLDTWDYDYITVYPSHKANSLSPPLVELSRDAVFETDIIYTPLLERVETVEPQREKSENDRKRVAINPTESLRTRTKLNDDTVILFDDICTTGSSLVGGTHLLREAGADRVVCITLGLTPGGTQANVREITDIEASASEIIAGVD